MRFFHLLNLALAGAAMTACTSIDGLSSALDPYRITIRQGNYVDQPMVAQLRKGMTQDQVQFVLGTPLIVDPFRSGRWDYVYLLKEGGKEQSHRTLSLFFEGGRLVRIDGDVKAADGTETAVERPRRGVVEIVANDAKD